MPEFVEATIRFLGPCDGKPIFFGHQRHLDNLPLEERKVRIRDLRPVAECVSLDREGFALVRRDSEVSDLFHPAARARYLSELECLIRELTGASKVVALGNGVIRRSERSPRWRKDGTTVLGHFAHCDFSSGAAGSRSWVEKVLPPKEAAQRLAGRFAIYNVWQALSEAPQDAPLAVCDARSVRAEDGVATDQVLDSPEGPEVRIENTVYRFNETQRWSFFSNMTPAEALVFKGFESEAARAGPVPHAAFVDPCCPPATPRRESIDERVVAFFGH